MNAPSASTNTTPTEVSPNQVTLLNFARRLDRFGRDAEQFVSQQLEQLEIAINEFERDKAAWRRQLRRESSQLAEQREQLEQLRESLGDGVSGSEYRVRFKRELAERDARKSGTAPIRVLLQPHAASSMQVAVLLFEISKLNRDMGGQGVRFEVAEVRGPRRRLLARNVPAESGAEIFELHGFPTLPLVARGNHVTLDVDITDRVEEWILFKTRLLQSALADGDLVTHYSRCRPVERNEETRRFIREATRPQERRNSRENEPDPYSGAALLPGSQIDVVRQQILRLESCYDRLHGDSGLVAQADA
jgi:hypothetical protein